MSFKSTGNAELDAAISRPDATFVVFRDSLPPNYWARYDISAVRLGWHFGREAARAEFTALPVETAALMREMADDIRVYVATEYPPESRNYPSNRRRYEASMEVVRRADAAVHQLEQQANQQGLLRDLVLSYLANDGSQGRFDAIELSRVRRDLLVALGCADATLRRPPSDPGDDSFPIFEVEDRS